MLTNWLAWRTLVPEGIGFHSPSLFAAANTFCFAFTVNETIPSKTGSRWLAQCCQAPDKTSIPYQWTDLSNFSFCRQGHRRPGPFRQSVVVTPSEACVNVLIPCGIHAPEVTPLKWPCKVKQKLKNPQISLFSKQSLCDATSLEGPHDQILTQQALPSLFPPPPFPGK